MLKRRNKAHISAKYEEWAMAPHLIWRGIDVGRWANVRVSDGFRRVILLAKIANVFGLLGLDLVQIPGILSSLRCGRHIEV